MWTLAIILILLWLLGFISSYTFGGLLHLLLVVALVVVVIRLVQGRAVT
ncbi:MAG: lmo0937 family membrane protein [Gemmatimonadales bacterium]